MKTETEKKFVAQDYVNNHADFKKYYDKNQKHNIWVLGYFGGGSVIITKALDLAKLYAKSTSVPLDTVQIDEILHSRRHKGFKFICSMEEQTPEDGSDIMDNVYQWLHD